ncbi:hypothetical protein JOB18_038772 [Solea senegalensis]|uniref:Acyl-coenzyme A thioesterase 1-like isoform X2 n=1 Tax=Solea senegalensis TaxID=28829 RepID=A0AAV6QW03_SOLSE|nr:acyl-coenzyme A thioesterase 1-like [Solea senegalensis]KAG7497503.1 acyl-coenzyme A thioesterase 1-like isoform X2 [Solea senegalensis]KAG7497504.1 hypothetical protein JOB18_038772 [Solea senegalensis]
MSQAAAPPVLCVAPSRALVDEKITVLVENLPPGSPVTVRSHHHSDDQDDWEAYAHYVSDHRGVVSVSDDMSFGGTYSGVEPMGLLWSLRPVPGSRTGLRLRKKNVCTPLLFHISVHSGHEGFRERPPLASALIERWYVAPGVQRIDVSERGVRGTLFLPPGPGPFPGVLDMWGGGGGLHEYRAALLACHGYVALALEYFKPGELKSTDLEYSYFETAFNLIQEHPRVMADRVGILGLSLGSSLALSLAAESKTVQPRACICIGSNHCSGRSLSGSPMVLITNPEGMRVDENNHHIWRDMALSILEDESKLVDVGKMSCPLMVVNGADDQNWPSTEMADDITRRMRAAGKEHLLTRLEYPDAGHLIEPPFSPHFRATNFMVPGRQKVILLWGGQTKPHSDAQEDSWRKILSFLQQHLYGNQCPKAKL